MSLLGLFLRNGAARLPSSMLLLLCSSPSLR